jgi:hypothetical protein
MKYSKQKHQFIYDLKENITLQQVFVKCRYVQGLFAKIIYMEFQKNPINGLVTDTRSQAGRQT